MTNNYPNFLSLIRVCFPEHEFISTQCIEDFEITYHKYCPELRLILHYCGRSYYEYSSMYHGTEEGFEMFQRKMERSR